MVVVISMFNLTSVIARHVFFDVFVRRSVTMLKTGNFRATKIFYRLTIATVEADVVGVIPHDVSTLHRTVRLKVLLVGILPSTVKVVRPIRRLC